MMPLALRQSTSSQAIRSSMDRLAAVAGGFCYTYDYRSGGKLLRKWSGGKPVISCTYYKNGSLKNLTDVSGKTLYYSYDENGKLSSLKDDEGKLLTEYPYTAGGRLKEIRTLDGTCASYSYDSDGSLSHLRIGNEEKNSTLYDAFMLYDLNGNRTKKQENAWEQCCAGAFQQDQ